MPRWKPTCCRKFGAGQYGTEVSALMRSRFRPWCIPRLWGGDLQAFILQSAPRGLFKKATVVFSAADHVHAAAGRQDAGRRHHRRARCLWPDVAPKSPLNDWFQKIYQDAYKVYPVQAPYRMVQVDPGREERGRKGDGKERRQEADQRGNRGRPDQPCLGLARWPYPHGESAMATRPSRTSPSARPSGMPRPRRWSTGRRYPALPGRMRQSAAEHEGPEWLKAGMPGAKCN